MDHWTEKITARRQLAEQLRNYPKRMSQAHLLPEDLEVVATEGRKAEEADAEQHEQLAEGTVDRSNRSREMKSLAERESDLRDVLPAVVDELGSTAPLQAQWLKKLSFARFRLREFTPAEATTPATPTTESGPDTGDAEGEEDIRLVRRVAAEDQVTRARNLGRYCRALLRPRRSVIVDELARRGYAREILERLAGDAEKFAEAGRNYRLSAEATEREAAAAGAQKQKWRTIRRMVRKAVRGDATLEKKFAEC